jgi:hypothetical protein
MVKRCRIMYPVLYEIANGGGWLFMLCGLLKLPQVVSNEWTALEGRKGEWKDGMSIM